MSVDEMFILFFLEGLFMTSVAVVMTGFTIKHGFRSQRGDTFACIAVISMVLGPMSTLGSIDQLVKSWDMPGWVGLVTSLTYVFVFVGAGAMAIRKALR